MAGYTLISIVFIGNNDIHGFFNDGLAKTCFVLLACACCLTNSTKLCAEEEIPESASRVFLRY